MTLPTYILPLVIWVGTLIVCILCVYVAWRGLFGDRGNGKRRCPKCWYDLAYSPSMTCAECGHTAQQEREFTRTRRRPMLALTAIFICVALVIAVNDQMNQKGMLRHVPTGLLIWMLPATGGMDASCGREIDRRATQQQLTASQWERLILRCAEGDWFSRPTSKSWIANYGGFIANWRSRFINDPKLEGPLLKIPPLVEARTRDTWPGQTPIVVAVRLEDWWPAGMECRVRAVPRLTGGDANNPLPSQTFYRGGESRFRPSPFAMYLPPLAAGVHELVIDFHVDRRRIDALARPIRTTPTEQASAEAPEQAEDDSERAWEPVGVFSSTLKTRIDGALTDLLKPVTSEELNSLMTQVFGNAVRWTGGGRSPVRFGINAPATFTSVFNDTAVGVSVELIRNDQVARRLNLWWIAGDNVADDQRNYGFEINFEDIGLLRQLEEGTVDQDGWQLRVRADPALALRAGSTKRFWQGEFRSPINLRMSQNVAPPRLWWTENDAVEEPREDAPPARGRGRRSL